MPKQARGTFRKHNKPFLQVAAPDCSMGLGIAIIPYPWLKLKYLATMSPFSGFRLHAEWGASRVHKQQILGWSRGLRGGHARAQLHWKWIGSDCEVVQGGRRQIRGQREATGKCAQVRGNYFAVFAHSTTLIGNFYSIKMEFSSI